MIWTEQLQSTLWKESQTWWYAQHVSIKVCPLKSLSLGDSYMPYDLLMVPFEILNFFLTVFWISFAPINLNAWCHCICLWNTEKSPYWLLVFDTFLVWDKAGKCYCAARWFAVTVKTKKAILTDSYRICQKVRSNTKKSCCTNIVWW